MIDKNEKPKDLQRRTKMFAIDIIRLVKVLEKDSVARVIGKQILRSGTSVAANYRASCRARSAKDFISKISIVMEEADETLFWLELLEQSGLVKAESLKELKDEAFQITAIMTASKNTAIINQKNK